MALTTFGEEAALFPGAVKQTFKICRWNLNKLCFIPHKWPPILVLLSLKCIFNALSISPSSTLHQYLHIVLSHGPKLDRMRFHPVYYWIEMHRIFFHCLFCLRSLRMRLLPPPPPPPCFSSAAWAMTDSAELIIELGIKLVSSLSTRERAQDKVTVKGCWKVISLQEW